MTHQFKVGDLAQIIKSEGLPERVFWIVTVERSTMTTMAMSHSGTHFTHISHPPLGPRAMTETDIPTAWLRPIKGDGNGVDEMVLIAGPAPATTETVEV